MFCLIFCQYGVRILIIVVCVLEGDLCKLNCIHFFKCLYTSNLIRHPIYLQFK